MKKILSIIIVTHNSEADIYGCIDSIFQYNDIGEKLEIIVVDNNSTNFIEMEHNISLLNKDIKVISNKTNGGYGQGNNLGIEQSVAPYFMIMNPDVRLIMPVFSKALLYLEQKNIAMVGMTQMSSIHQKGISYSVKTSSSGFSKFVITTISNKLGYYNYKTMYLSGACFFMKKVVFDQIGKFDEHIFLYGEENDLFLRLRKLTKNLKIKYIRGLKYLHPTEYRKFSEQQLYLMCKSNMYVFEKNNLSPLAYINTEIRKSELIYCVSKLRKKRKSVIGLLKRIYFLKVIKQEFLSEKK